MPTPVDIMKAPALKLLSKGLATITEVARATGKPHQTVRNWAAGIDVDKARQKYVDACLRAALRPKKR